MLTDNTVKTAKLGNIITTEICKMSFILGKAEFSASLLRSSVTGSYKNHSNTLIWGSRNISYYYQCSK